MNRNSIKFNINSNNNLDREGEGTSREWEYLECWVYKMGHWET